MSNHQKRVKAASAAFEEVAAENPALVYASEAVARAMQQLITFVQNVDPGLTWEEATVLAAGILRGLPAFITSDPRVMDSIREKSQELKARRR